MKPLSVVGDIISFAFVRSPAMLISRLAVRGVKPCACIHHGRLLPSVLPPATPGVTRRGRVVRRNMQRHAIYSCYLPCSHHYQFFLLAWRHADMLAGRDARITAVFCSTRTFWRSVACGGCTHGGWAGAFGLTALLAWPLPLRRSLLRVLFVSCTQLREVGRSLQVHGCTLNLPAGASLSRRLGQAMFRRKKSDLRDETFTISARA